jgi:hypothetical protein
VLATVSGVGTGQAHVGHPALVDVHRTHDQGTGRKFDHERADAEVQQRAVRCVGVGGEDQLLRRTLEDAEDLVRHDSDLLVALHDGRAGDRRVEELVRLNRPGQVSVVVGALDRLRCRTAVLDAVFTVTH